MGHRQSRCCADGRSMVVFPEGNATTAPIDCRATIGRVFFFCPASATLAAGGREWASSHAQISGRLRGGCPRGAAISAGGDAARLASPFGSPVASELASGRSRGAPRFTGGLAPSWAEALQAEGRREHAADGAPRRLLGRTRPRAAGLGWRGGKALRGVRWRSGVPAASYAVFLRVRLLSEDDRQRGGAARAL